jgi:hypothetical protein
MKRKLARVLAPLAAVALVLGVAASPARAGVNFNVTIGSESCQLYGYYLVVTESRVTANSCNRAQARIKYITSGGSTSYAYGVNASYGFVSIATAGCQMQTQRAGRGAIVEGGTFWSAYKAYYA